MMIYLCCCSISIFTLVNFSKVFCIWPPPYNINLSQEETFEIFDPINIYENEMISREDMKNLNVESQDDKYYRIHRSLETDNKHLSQNETDELIKKSKIFEEFNPDAEYLAPFKAGFANEDKFDDYVMYFENQSENTISQDFQKKKRNNEQNSTEEYYDYKEIKDQFNVELKQAATLNETLNYTNFKEDESIKDNIKVFLTVKEHRNCSEDERSGIGLAAMECIWIDLHKQKMKSYVLEKIIRIAIIWLIIYLIIAIPLWCQYGWCCCCCRCKICQPYRQIDEVKQFLAQNPPGVYHDQDGNVIKYQPTKYEKYAQRMLEDELRKL